MSTDKSISTVCRVTATGPEKGGWSAQGVFVSPRRVLTNWHAVQGAKTLTFTNILGMESTMKPARDGGRHLFDAEMDVALVELKFPIGHEIALPPRGLPSFRPAFDRARAVLKTCYGDKPALHELGYSMIDGIGHPHHKSMMPFSAAIRVVQGYSGSPIFAEDGITLLSLITAIIPQEQEHAYKLHELFQGRVNAKLPPPAIPFLAIRPDMLAHWYRKAERELNL